MSGPTFVVISRVKGAVQAREMVGSCIVTLREPTAERTPNTIHDAQSLNSRTVANVPCNNSSEVQLTTVVDTSVSIHVILVMLYSTGKLVIVSSPTPSVVSAVTLNSVVTLLRLRFFPFTSHSTLAASRLIIEVQMNRASPPTLDVISLSLQPWPSA